MGRGIYIDDTLAILTVSMYLTLGHRQAKPFEANLQLTEVSRELCACFLIDKTDQITLAYLVHFPYGSTSEF